MWEEQLVKRKDKKLLTNSCDCSVGEGHFGRKKFLYTLCLKSINQYSHAFLFRYAIGWLSECYLLRHWLWAAFLELLPQVHVLSIVLDIPATRIHLAVKLTLDRLLASCRLYLDQEVVMNAPPTDILIGLLGGLSSNAIIASHRPLFNVFLAAAAHAYQMIGLILFLLLAVLHPNLLHTVWLLPLLAFFVLVA